MKMDQICVKKWAKKRVNKQLESYYVHPQDKIQKKITISQNCFPQILTKRKTKPPSFLGFRQ